MRKLTPYFDGNVKPIRPGIYECRSCRRRGDFYYWNGMYWEYGGEREPSRVRRTSEQSPEQYKEWRGLAEQPK